MRGVARIVLWAGCVIGLPPAGMAQTSEQGPPCMQCHKPSATTIDPIQFARSVHSGLNCTDCHTQGVSKFPHASVPAQMPDCIDCHVGATAPGINFDKIAADVAASVHVKLVDRAFRCTNCHSPHYFIPASRMTDAAAAIVVFNQGCLGCHAAGATAAAIQAAFTKLGDKHQLFPHWELHIQRNACIECHTPRGQKTIHLILPKSQALKDCAGCHAQNSLLITNLYAHLSLKERAEPGWVNAILFNNAYLTGATRNQWLDWGSLALAVMTILGAAAHGMGRLLFAGIRRNS